MKRKKIIIESLNGEIIETEQYDTKLLTEAEVRERVKDFPKIDVQELLRQGYVEARKFHHDLENGLL